MAATGKTKAWKKIFEGNSEVPLPYDRQKNVSSDSLPYCLSIRTADVSSAKASKGATFQIRLTFYDLTYKQFYGRTWSGPLVPGKAAGGKTKITYNQNVYFHTSLDAETLVVVVEVVAVDPPGANGKQKQVGCGWGIFHPFQKDKKLFDTSGAAPPPVKLDMYDGSPRALLFLDEPIIGNPHLNSNGCQVQYVIQTHRIMQKSINLIPENTFVSHHDVIPGISDADKSSSGGDFLRRPRLIKRMSCYLEKIQVTLNPSLEKLEEELCKQLNEDRINRENQVADGTSISVIERRLQVGVHNGWCYVDKPEVVNLTPDVASQKGGTRSRSGSRGHQRSSSTSSIGSGTLLGATALVHKNRVELDGMLEDPTFTLVFLLEYVLGEPIGRNNKDRRMKGSMAKAATFNITVRWAAWCPISNMESPEQSIQLIGGPSSIPDSTFVYSLSAENVGSLDSLRNLNGGVVKFTFVNTKSPIAKSNTRDPTNATLNVPTLNVPTLNLPDTARPQDDSTDLLEGQIAGRPPIPASTKATSSSDSRMLESVLPKVVRRSLDFGKVNSSESGRQSYSSCEYKTLSSGSFEGYERPSSQAIVSKTENLSCESNIAKQSSGSSFENRRPLGTQTSQGQTEIVSKTEVPSRESDVIRRLASGSSYENQRPSGTQTSQGQTKIVSKTDNSSCESENTSESSVKSFEYLKLFSDGKIESVTLSFSSDEQNERSEGHTLSSTTHATIDSALTGTDKRPVPENKLTIETSSESTKCSSHATKSVDQKDSGEDTSKGIDSITSNDETTISLNETEPSSRSDVQKAPVNETMDQVINEYQKIQLLTPIRGQKDKKNAKGFEDSHAVKTSPPKTGGQKAAVLPARLAFSLSSKLQNIPEENRSYTSSCSAIPEESSSNAAKSIKKDSLKINNIKCKSYANDGVPDGGKDQKGTSSSTIKSHSIAKRNESPGSTEKSSQKHHKSHSKLERSAQNFEKSNSTIKHKERSLSPEKSSSKLKNSPPKHEKSPPKLEKSPTNPGITLARTMDQFGASYGSHQSMYHPGQMYSMPMGMPGYPSSGYGSPSMYGATSPIPGYGGVPQGYGGPASMHSYQPSPRMNVPVEIAHVRDHVTPGMITDLTELPFTPVHAPVMATVPGRHIMSGMSRQAYARLFTVGFPQILDQHGEPPEVVDPNDELQFIMTKEELDRLQTNEITLQFLAYARVFTPDSVREKPTPSSIFMTFQFYRFPQVTTERLLLGTLDGQLTSDPNAMPSILQKLNADGSLKKGPPGWQVVYNVDPAYLKPGEGRLFVQHLSQQILHIDVWDGDSLLLIGSSAVELKHLCRQGREGVQVTYELDVITTEYIDYETPTPAGNMAQNGFLKPMEVKSLLKGKLHLRMANVGRPADQKLSKSDRMPMSVKPKVVVTPEGNGLANFNGGGLGSLMQHTAATLKPKKCKAKHMVEKNHELASMISSRKNEDRSEKSGETNAARKRKLARMEAVRSQLDETKTVSTYRSEKEERARDFQTIDLYRKQNKREEILGMLSQALTTEHVLSPSMGTTEFFEFVLKNPYNVEHTVTIQCDDPELMVITNPREWRHFKMVNEIYTSVEEEMFSADAGKTLVPPQLFLRAKETVHVPFKFLTFKADNGAIQAAPADPHRTKPADAQSYPGIQRRDPMATRVAKVVFNTSDGKPVAILQVKIEPQPHIIDQTFRFHHPEHSFLKKSIRLPPLHTIPGVPIGGPGISQLVVMCSDPNVICESRKVQPGEPHDIFIKVACGASPQVKKFFLAIYADHFTSRPITVWQIFVHALQRVDIAGSEGQTSRFTLILRGTQASRLVKCFASHPLEMSLRPNDPFMLAANTLQELEVGLRPSISGSKFYYINVVDVEFHQLIRSWLICLTMSHPLITKNYELTLPVGGGKGSNKRLAYTNPYPSRKVFTIHCNRPDLLQFKDTRMDLGPGEVHHIGLRFAPAIAPGATEILVFINDEDDKNEETFCVRASYQ